MPVSDDVSFELKNYAFPRTMIIGVADRRSGADTLVLLSGTLIVPPAIVAPATDAKIQRKRIRFLLPQSPKVLTSGSQLRGMQVVTGLASIHSEGQGDRTFAIDQAIIDWDDNARELRVAIDTAIQGPGSSIHRITYQAFVLAQTA